MRLGELVARYLKQAGDTEADSARLLPSVPVLPPARDEWPEAWVEDFEERAAIMEFDGRMTRAEAERAAETCVRTRFRRRHTDAARDEE